MGDKFCLIAFLLNLQSFLSLHNCLCHLLLGENGLCWHLRGAVNVFLLGLPPAHILRVKELQPRHDPFLALGLIWLKSVMGWLGAGKESRPSIPAGMGWKGEQTSQRQQFGGWDTAPWKIWLEVKLSTCNAGDLGSIPGLGRSPGEGKGKATHSSILAWRIP